MIGQRLRLFRRRGREAPSEERLIEAIEAARHEPQLDASSAEAPDNSLGFELLLYGNEQILRGSDNGTLLAFAAIAFQQIRGRGAMHNDVGCGILMLSVLLCALVHFAIGYAYVGRAQKIIRRRAGQPLELQTRRGYTYLAWFAIFLQFLCVIVGTVLILIETAPPWIQEALDNVFPWVK